MRNNPLLMTDGYKSSHRQMYPQNTSLVYSNYTCRSTKYMHESCKDVVVFGTQYVFKYIKDLFDNDFFTKDKNTVCSEAKQVLSAYLGGDYDVAHFEALHDLGYLPIEVKALEEGMIVKHNIPLFTIKNTKPEFFWVTNFLETLISTLIWKPVHSASVAYGYKKILVKYAKETGMDLGFVNFQGHDFSFRGMQSPEAAVSSGLGFLTSFMGTDTLPALLASKQYYNSDNVAFSVPACYDKETEILTENGWKLFENLGVNELVAQYNPDKTIEFVKPLDYFKDRYKGKMIKFSKSKGYKYIDVLVTPNHKMVKLHKSGKVNLFEASDYKQGYSDKNDIIISGCIKDDSTNKLTDLERLKIAFQADGSFPSHKEDYNGTISGAYPIRFSLKKERKKERLLSLLDSLKLKYTMNKGKKGYISFWINVPEPFVKDFSWVNLANFSYGKCVDFINELQYWDGCRKNNCISYSSTNISCIDMIQAICSISNHKTHFNVYLDKRTDNNRLPSYTLTIQIEKNYVKGNNIIREEVDYDDYVYCVSVPSKMIITRRNNTVIVCGNTEHSVMCSHGKESEIDTLRYLMAQFPTGILSVVSDTWDLWKLLTVYLPELKEEILARDGKLVCRPDSGDPVDILCGEGSKYITFTDINELNNWLNSAEENEDVIFKYEDRFYKIGDVEYFIREYGHENINYGFVEMLDERQSLLEDVTETINVNAPSFKGVVELLWDTFGGTVNEQGYKVLDSHIGAIYGDSITPERAIQIAERLKAKGFANQVVLGVGSYSLGYATRDNQGGAVKSTYVVVDNEGREIYKDPITDNGTKKSAKGLLKVDYNSKGEITLYDQVSLEEEKTGLLQTIFIDGTFVKETNLTDIRERISSSI